IFILMLLAVFCAPLAAQEEGQTDEAGASQEINSLGERIGTMMKNYFSSLEKLATEEVLINAITDENEEQLQQLATQYQEQLPGSLRVRLYIKGKERPDEANSPSCGFACIAIIKAAYTGDPPAEALLFHSSDANLTLVRKVRDQAGQTIGAIVAHYPFSLLKQEIGKLQNISIYTELRQVLAGPTVTLFSHGNPEVKSGIAQKFVRIPNSKWLIAVWTPGGVGVEQYSETELPWLYMTLAVIALVGGLAILIIYRVKHPAPKKPAKPAAEKFSENLSPEAVSYDNDYDDSPTLILGGGARDVDVSKYLKGSGNLGKNK
ncbi:MAG TPA: hypothetical protein VIU36_08660, partial [Gammaproteobacteria bacterium]